MPTQSSSINPIPGYKDPTSSAHGEQGRLIGERVDDLVSRMTLAEKVSQMAFEAPAIERLGIPAYNWWNECLHGVARAGVATVFPQAIGLAATWDVDLMGEVATAISDEARAKHHEFLRRGVRDIYTGLTFWSPNVNIFRDPRWGRGQETYGEDPYLTSRMGVAFVKGLQGDDPNHLKLAATPKHFAVHSGPEISRHEFDARVGERDLRETYLPAFEACVKEGDAASIMGAYNRLNGEPCCASPTLLRKILREEWGFEGYVASDCWAINDIFGGHKAVETPAEAAARAVKAGCDLECGCIYLSLLEAVERGLIDEATIDRAVTRLFAARYRLGMFDPPEQVSFARIPYEINDSAEHRGLALRAARESIVLLKNDGLLPLAKELKSVAVIGPVADDLAALLGNYCGTPSHAVTPLEGIRRKVSPETAVHTAQGCEIAAGVPPLCAVPAAHLRPSSARLQGSGVRGRGSGVRSQESACGLTGAYFPGRAIPDPLKPSTLNPSTGSGQALEPSIVRIDPFVDFAWRDASPLGGQVTEPFCVRWTGTLIPPTSGRYLLGVRGSSGYQLWLDGCELLPYEANDHEVFTRTIPLELEGSRLYDVRLDYVNQGRDPQVQLLWAVPGGNYASDALQVAEKAEVVVMVMGLSPALEGEDMPVHVNGFAGGDRTDIALPWTQEALLRQIHALGKPVVLVLMGGSALAVNWADTHVPAILAAWYPGEEGGTAIADVLFGDYNPAGRLPVTFYKSLDQLPPFNDYNMAGRTYRYMAGEPLYPFGHGLSYTHFQYANLRIEPEQIGADGKTTVSLDVTNLGAQAGAEVVQLYVSYPGAAVPRPVKELRGFDRVALAPGETQTVQFILAADQLTWWDGAGWAVEPGRVQVLVGSSSEDIRLQREVRVSGT